MANGDKRTGTIMVRFHEDHWGHIKPSLDILKDAGKKYPAIVMACMIEGEHTFRRNPKDIITFREKWKPIEDESLRKPFRCPETFKEYFDKLSSTIFNTDLNSFIIAAIHRDLRFFEDNPERVDIVYLEWLEKQLALCMTAKGGRPRQTCMTDCMTEAVKQLSV